MPKLILKKEKAMGGSFMKKWDATKAKVKKQQADDLMDSYLNAIEYKDMSVCSKCRSIYHDKRWAEDKELYNLLMKDPEKVIFTVCPACRKIETKYMEGVVELKGDFLFEHKDEIISLIKNTVEKADYIDPLEKIENINIDEKNKTIEIITTDDKLAQRIGKNIEKAYKGNVEYHFSKEDRLTRVYWKR
jgi:hypothetical protein